MPFGSVTLNDGKKIPAIAFGRAKLCNASCQRSLNSGREQAPAVSKHTDVTQIVHQALEAGVHHIDTAAYYENEANIGTVIQESGRARSDLYLTTKFGNADVHEEFRKSLSNLGLNYVDLYLIHDPSMITDIGGTWKEFENFRRDGLAKSIGVSNFTLEQLQQLVQTALVRPAVHQIEFLPYNYAQQKALVDWSSKNGIVTAAYSSLSSITKFGGPLDAPVAAAAACLDCSPAQILLSWARAKGVIIVTTTGNKERLAEYLAVADLPPLTEAEIAAIDDAGAKGSGYCQDRDLFGLCVFGAPPYGCGPTSPPHRNSRC